MSHTYTATPGNAVPGSTLTITVPDDGDARTAAAQNTPDQRMADEVDFARRALRPDCPAVSQQTWLQTPTFGGTSATVGDLSLVYPAGTVPVATAPDGFYIRASLVVGCNAAASSTTIQSKNAAFVWTGALRARYELDLSMSAIGANNLQIVAGFGASGGVAPTHFNGAAFSKLSTDTNWQCYTDDGTTRTANQTGYVATAPVASTIQRLRIDCFGSSVSGGARAEFYINDSLVCTNTSNLALSSTPLFPWVLVGNTSGGANANTVRVGLLTVRF